jgi:hypothetical protein
MMKNLALFLLTYTASVFFSCPSFAVEPQNSVAVQETDPPSPATLNNWDNLSFHMGYTVDRPVRIRVEGFSGGAVQPATNSGTVIYGPGSGDAYFYISYMNKTHIDRVDVTVTDQAGTTVATTSLPVDMTWTGVATGALREQAAWVKTLRDDMSQHAKADASWREAHRSAGENAWGAFAGVLAFLAAWSVPGYLILQVVFLRRWQDGWRRAALVPLVPMGAALVFVLYACLVKDSNIAPIIIVFMAPFAFLYLVVVWVLRRKALAKV